MITLQQVAPARLAGWFYVPLSAISGGRMGEQALRQTLTYYPKFDDPEKGPVHLFDTSRPGYLGVPRAFGRQQFRHLDVDDQRSMGLPITVCRVPEPNHPRVQDPVQQAKFMADLKAGMLRHEEMVAMAATGSGKTVCALRTAAELGRTTIVLLHLERLLDQWVQEIMDKLGVPEGAIGIVRQGRCDFMGKPFCVAMMPSLASRGVGGYPPELFEYFGTQIVDETHKMGTREFAPVAPMFSAYYRLGLSATPDRKDGGERVFFWHLGPIQVVSNAQALPMSVHVMDYDCGNYPLWGRTPQARVSCLTKDPVRNQLLASVVRRFYETGRSGLIVSHSVSHLQTLMDMAEDMGVPRSAMGQFTGEQHLVYREVCPRTERTVRRTKKRRMTKKELADVKENAQIIFTTYGMMTEGIDIPRLDAGCDATPRGQAIQLIGRLRRPVPGKKHPRWVTIRDIRCPISRKLFKARRKDYAACGAEVVFNDHQRGRSANAVRG